ncbi:hypothetical protein JXB01_01160 [Candidatus Micrarchaeota archaeon]|nr:hypothetical protein [Candidatus Micrarchaeota archaeon]
MEKIDEAFRSACRVLLGEEIGELYQFKDYLLSMVPKSMRVKSSVSGKDICLSRDYYCKNAEFASLEEITGNSQKISIDDIKDIDALLCSLKENMSYCGNNNIGNSRDVVDSDSCQDGICILNTHQVLGGKFIAYSHGIRRGEYIFGSVWSGENSFLMRCQGMFFSKNCYESYLSTKSRNLYFSFNCRSCSEMFFSFNQVSKQFMIGNVSLPKERYHTLKKKLLSELAEKLKRNKKFPSLFELCSGVDNNE